MGSKVGKCPKREHRTRTYRDQRVIAFADVYEYALISLAARMTGQNITDFVREASIAVAMVALDTGRKHRLAVEKGVELYGVNPKGETDETLGDRACPAADGVHGR